MRSQAIRGRRHEQAGPPRFPYRAQEVAQTLTKLAADVRQAIAGLPLAELDAVTYMPEAKEAAVYLAKEASSEAAAAWGDAVAICLPEPKVAWVLNPGEVTADSHLEVVIARGISLPDHEKIAQMYEALDEDLSRILGGDSIDLVKRGVTRKPFSPTLRAVGELAGYLPGGSLSWHIPGVPRHLQGMLGGALLGAGAGYGAGWLGSKILPRSWDRDRLPRTFAILGSLAGASPGAAAMLSNVAKGPDSSGKTYILSDDSLFRSPPLRAENFLPTLPKGTLGPNSPQMPESNPHYNPHMPRTIQPGPDTYKLASEQLSGALPPAAKKAISETGHELDFGPNIPVDRFAADVWYDPRVAGAMPAPVRAAGSKVPG